MVLRKGSPPGAAICDTGRRRGRLAIEPPNRIVGPEAIEDFVAEWRNLAASVAGCSYFQTPDWVLAWWETLGGRPLTEYAVWRGASGRLEAVVALSRIRERIHPRLPFGVRVWVNSGSGAGAADHCGWVVLPRRVADVRSWVEKQTAGALELRNLGSEAAYVPPSALPVDESPCPRLDLPLEGGVLGRSRNFRQQLRARERKVAAAGVTFDWVGGAGVDDSLLDRIITLHGGRSTQMGWGTTFDRSRLPFHRLLVERSSDDHGPVMVVARHQDDVIGIVYGFWWQGTFSYYQLGWDEAWARFGLGTVLLAAAIRHTAERGGKVFDFLRGSEEFKYRFGAVDVVDRSWLLRRGVAARLLAWKRRRRRTGS
ncbi:MAG: GNAT family N-acetyltransferase [Acidimicrobiia bacterium]